MPTFLTSFIFDKKSTTTSFMLWTQKLRRSLRRHRGLLAWSPMQILKLAV